MRPDPLALVERSPLTLLHLLVVGLCACGFAMDFVEVTMGGALSAIFAAPPLRLHGLRLSWLLSASNAGAIIGAPLTGWIADRRGLQSTLIWTVLWLAVTAVFAAFSPTDGWLATARFLSGFALGAYPPLMMSYLTDILPKPRRGVLIFTVCAIAYIAPPVALFATRTLTIAAPLGFAGWRWVFLATGAVCALSGGLWLFAPEAPHWLAARGRDQALQNVISRFVRSRRIGPRRTRLSSKAERPEALRLNTASSDDAQARASSVAMIFVIYFLIGCVAVSFPLLTGPILLNRHYNLSDTLFYVGLATFGPVLGALAGGPVADRVGRLPVMAGSAFVMLASIVLFFYGRGLFAMASSLIAFGISSTLYMPAMTVYAAEFFAPSRRGRATATAWACNRVGATLSPMVLLAFMHGGDTGLVALCLAAALAASLLAIVKLSSSTRPQPEQRVA